MVCDKHCIPFELMQNCPGEPPAQPTARPKYGALQACLMICFAVLSASAGLAGTVLRKSCSLVFTQNDAGGMVSVDRNHFLRRPQRPALLKRFCLTSADWVRLIFTILLLATGIGRAFATEKSTSIEMSPLDSIFVDLRQAALANKAELVSQLAAKLTHYPEQAYVEYYRLRPELYDSGGNIRAEVPDQAIQSFLMRYPKMAIADRLRNDWLLALGKRRDWIQFDQQYPQFALNDDVQVKCYALMSKVMQMDSAAYPELRSQAVALMQDPKYMGEACIDLASASHQKGLLTRKEVKMLARWALEQKFATLARRLAGNTNIDDADSDWLAKLASDARKDPEQAAVRLSRLHRMSSEEQGAAWGVVGQFLAKDSALRQLAVQAFKKQTALGGDALLSPQSHIWKVRMALLEKDWAWVEQSIEKMPTALRDRDPAWTYWYAVALKERGKASEAREQFQSLAGQFDFYGLLAREAMGLRVVLPSNTLVSEEEIARVQNLPGFARAQKFYALDLRFEGTREWNWTLRDMSDRELLAAAEYAQRINLLDRTVSTADRTRKEHNFSLRYVMPHRQLVARVTHPLKLDMAWVYGLIRQESRFIARARSSVGASGLMQVMPKTAHYVARKIGLTSYTHSDIDSAETNILLGVNYLNIILHRFDDSWVLASAAYNAGPGRAKKWRAALQKDVDGAIFAEAIHFDETRSYVKNVLANATLYSAVLTGKPQSLQHRLGEIRGGQQVSDDELP